MDFDVHRRAEDAGLDRPDTQPAQAVGEVVAQWRGQVGAGSVGLTAAMHLARLGPRALAIVDRARFKRESLLTHLIDPGTSRWL